jgi:hypothetical protein
MGSDLVPGASVTLPASGGAPEAKNVGGVISFRGFEQGREVLALGVQRGSSLVPGVLRPGERARLLLGPIGPDDIVLAEEERGLGGHEAALGFFGGLALLLVFSHPLGVVRFVCFCGVGDVFAAFFQHGIGVGLARLVKGLAAVGAPVGTFVAARSVPSFALVLAGTLVFSLAVVLARLAKGLEETETEQDDDF